MALSGCCKCRRKSWVKEHLSQLLPAAPEVTAGAIRVWV